MAKMSCIICYRFCYVSAHDQFARYANLFMRNWNKCSFRPNTENLYIAWWRCVDNILAIWTHGKAALQEVLASLYQHRTRDIERAWGEVKGCITELQLQYVWQM